MEKVKSFKERVRDVAVAVAPKFKSELVEYDYLVCSKAFELGYQIIKVLYDVPEIFCKRLFAEENFRKNKVECNFATSDEEITLGFASSGRPKSLMNSNKLSDKAKDVDLIFRRPRHSDEEFVLYFGDAELIAEYLPQIVEFIKSDAESDYPQ